MGKGIKVNIPLREYNAYKGLVEAAKKFVKQIDIVHDDVAYKGIWFLAHNHGMPYKGPQYKEELNNLKTTIDALEKEGG